MKTLSFILSLALAWTVSAQTTYKISQLTELSAEPDSGDFLMIWDTSASMSKKISRSNFLADSITPEVFGLTDPGVDRLIFWDDSAGTYRHLTLGTNLSIDDTTLNATGDGGTATSLPSARIAYGAADNTVTSEAGFEYDAVFNNLKIPTMISLGSSGSAFAMYSNGSGSLTMFNDFTDETLIFNLGVGGADTAFLSSDSGVNLLDFGSIEVKVPTEAYDATNWNGSTEVPTKDAIRDKIEAITVGSASLTGTYVGYGDGSNNLTGEAAFTYNATSNTLTAANISATSLTTTDLNVTNLNADGMYLVETEGSGTDTVELYVQSTQTANRRFGIAMPDADTEITFPASITVAGINYVNLWSDGIKQTFNPNGTNAGVNVGAHTADPSTLVNGDLWYNSTTNELKARINGSSVALGAGGGGGGSVATDTIWDTKGDLAVGTGSNTASKLVAGSNGQVLTADSAESTGLKWAPAGGNISSFKRDVFLWDEFLHQGSYNTTYNAIAPFGWKSTLSSGASAAALAAVSASGSFGLSQLATGSTGTPASGLGTLSTAIIFNAGQAASYNFETRIITGSSISNAEIRIGFLDSVTATEPTDGVYFRYQSSVDPSWICVCRSNNTETSSTIDSGTDVATSTAYVLRVSVNATGTSAAFYINGTQVTGSPISTNIPGGSAGRATGIGYSIYSTEAVNKEMNLDYAGLEVSYSSSR